MHKVSHILLCLGLFLGAFVPVCTQAQVNLVTNGSFETYTQCPFNITDTDDEVNYAKGWKRPTQGKSLFYNACSPKYTGLSVPTNWVGTRGAMSGNAYMGLCAYREPVAGADPGNRREYIQTELTQPLKAGRKYYFEMYVTRADSGLLGYAVKNLGALFTPNAIARNDSNELNATPQVESSSFITDKVNWKKLSGSFTASGGERFLTIGRFGAEGVDQVLSINGTKASAAYYYIDDVLLIDSCSDFDATVENILGPDSTFCKYGPISKTLIAANPKTTQYTWKNGSIFPNLMITDTGKYWVKMSNGICVNYDTIAISSNAKPSVNLGPDTTICFGRPVKLQPKHLKSFYSYSWYIFTSGLNFSVGTGSSYTATTQNFFILKATDFSCSAYDTILVFKSIMDTLILRTDTNLCRQAHFLLNATTNNATKYKWNTGETTPSIYTSAKEKYWVTVSDGLCSVRDTVNIGLQGPEKPIHDTEACENTLLVISADPGAHSYLWNTNANTPDIVVYNNGMYTITQSKNGCTSKDSIYVTIDKVPVVHLGADTNVCINPLYALKAISPYAKKFIWSTGDTTQTIQVGRSGVYAVRTDNNTCWSSDTIDIHTQLKVPFSFGEDVNDCFNSNIILTTSPANLDSFAWSTGVSDSFIVVKTPGTYWLKTNKGYCTNVDTITFYAKNKPILNLRNDTTVCRGTLITIDALNAQNSITWNTGDTAHVITRTKPGFYSAKVTNSEGCFTIDSFYLYNFATPPILHHTNAVVCADSMLELSANTFFTSYTWSNGSTAKAINVDKSGLYWVTITDSLGCKHTDSAKVVLRPRPQVLIETKVEACELLNIILEPQIEYKHYLWNYTDTNRTFTVTKHEMIHLQVTDTNNCSNEITILVTNSCPSSAKIPNVFTPNNDGTNDIIIPEYVNIKSTDFKIYNRWGKLVFETTDLTKAWDGREETNGTYFFVLKCEGNHGEQFAENGTITLIR